MNPTTAPLSTVQQWEPLESYYMDNEAIQGYAGEARHLFYLPERKIEFRCRMWSHSWPEGCYTSHTYVYLITAEKVDIFNPNKTMGKFIEEESYEPPLSTQKIEAHQIPSSLAERIESIVAKKTVFQATLKEKNKSIEVLEKQKETEALYHPRKMIKEKIKTDKKEVDKLQTEERSSIHDLQTAIGKEFVDFAMKIGLTIIPPAQIKEGVIILDKFHPGNA